MSGDDRLRKAETIFMAAMDAPPERRAALLVERCGADPQLRAMVEELLSHDAGGMGEFLEAGPGRRIIDSLAAATPDPRTIGQYTILRKLGEGGMGVVYEARQASPQRTVALKVIRPGLINPALLRRFRHEAEVLGQLQHPGIAHIYESGTVDGDGRQPYFAMEFIRGRPLNEYLAAAPLTAAQKMELAARICDAVQHAHQKGVIHRDLKPGNILVADGQSRDGDSTGNTTGHGSSIDAGLDAAPKILDFGIARVTGSDMRNVTMQTDVGQIIGTIPYMSPEQVLGDSAAIDTRSDVYSLGVILYEMLAGRLPLEVRQTSLAEAARIIREEEPPRIGSLVPALRGDVETIVAKALDKDKDHRYATAAELAADLRRFLRDEPITARPASAIYQIRKFARRNRALVGGVLATIIALAAGLIGTLRYAMLEGRQRAAAQSALTESQRARDAEAAQRRVAQEARDAARSEADKANSVIQFLTGMLASADPSQTKGDKLTLVDMLDQAASRIGASDSPPAVEGVIRTTIGATYSKLGRRREAAAHLDQAVELLRKASPSGSAELIRAVAARSELAIEHEDQPAEAERMLRASLDMARKLGESDPALLARMLHNLSCAIDGQGRWNEAITTLQEAIDIRRRTLPADHPDLAVSLNAMAYSLTNLGRLDEGEKLYLEALASYRKVYGPNHIDVVSTLSNLASLERNRQNYARVEQYVLEALPIALELYGPGHPATALLRFQLSEAYLQLKRYADAEQPARQSLEARRKLYDRNDPVIATTLTNLSVALRYQKKYAESEAAARESLEIRRQSLGDDSTWTAYSVYRVADVLMAQERFGEAEPLVLESLEKHERTFGRDHHLTDRARDLVLELYQRWDRPKKLELWKQRFAALKAASQTASQPAP